jgi:cell division protein FtsW
VAINFKSSLWELWLPVFILVLILPANFSALIFAMILMLVFIGKYPLKYWSYCRFWNFLLFLFLLPKLFPILAFSRVTTWERIENFSTDKPDEDDYQIEKLKLLLHLERFMDLVLGKVFRRTFAAILV